MPGKSLTRRTLLAQFAAFKVAFGQTFPSPVDPLRSLRSEHPRLILPDNELSRILALTRDHPLARKLRENLERDADKIQAAPPLDFKYVGRRVLDRILTLALLYRLDHRPQYLQRALKELRASALFPNWNPQHFLDVADMTYGFAIAYDWFYGSLEAAEKDWIAAALTEKGLDAGLAAYKEPVGWVTANHDWNLVCNSGLGIGALALADREPEKARRVLTSALESLPRALASYAPDGGWPEGPGYWNYSTRYLVSFLASLTSALDNDFQLADAHGFERTGRFRVYSTGPTNKTFNFADGVEDAGLAPEMFWLARRFDQPVFAWHEQVEAERGLRTDPLDLVWFYKDSRPASGADWPPDTLFTGVQIALMRGSWDDPNTIFLGVKGGDNKMFHSHLDLGSFVLDAGGVRWAYDPGPEDFNVPAYFGNKRYTYFKTSTESHSTVLVDGENQDRKGEARITRHEFGPDLSWVQVDLSRAYPGKVRQFQRRMGIAQKQAVLIEDTLKADQPVDALWGMMTQADITVSGQTAQLRKNDWVMSCEIHSPHHAVFDIVQNENTQKLVARLGTKVTDLDLNIVLIPYKVGQPKPVVSKRFPV